MDVEEVMTQNPQTIETSASVRDALKLMMEMDVRHLPVVDGPELVGIVSDRDLRAIIPFSEEVDTSELGRALSQSVSDLMSGDVQSVGPETDLGELIDLMVEYRIGAMPVVAKGTKDLVGIVSYIDVLKAARDSL